MTRDTRAPLQLESATLGSGNPTLRADSRPATHFAATMTLCAALLVAPQRGLPQQTSNHELRALPAEQQIRIDGDLGDWDLSGQILMSYDIDRLLGDHSAKAAALYDERGLYLAVDVRDATPMQNRWDPTAQPWEGWRGDSAQLYFWDDPSTPPDPGGSRVAQITVWWSSEAQRPGASMLVGRLGFGREPEARLSDLSGQGIDLAYRQHEDGQGYTAELRIDWELLSRDGKARHPGDSLGMGLEILWGNAAGDGPEHRLTDLLNPTNPQRAFFWTNPEAWGRLRFLADNGVEPSDSLKSLDVAARLNEQRYSTTGPVAIPYDLPAKGFVTLVIEGQDGKRIRNLIADYPRAEGRNVDYWDGLDDEGRPAAPGQYRVRGLFHEGIDVKYEFAFGNPSMPPWPSADGHGGWLSNHTNPMAVLADKERIYVAAPESEGPYPLIALDYDGNQVWGGLSRWYAGYMAREGDDLYVVNERDARPLSDPTRLDKPARIELIRIDPETGRERPFPDGQSRHEIARWNIAQIGAARQWEGATIERHAHDVDWAGLNAAGMAALNGSLYVSLHFEDKLLRIDARTGKVTGEIPLPEPAGLAADGERLLAISGKSIVALDPGDGTVTTVVEDHLEAPIDLAMDSGGNIYASDWADQMCVKVFSPEGEYRKHIGRMGGRPWRGPYDASGMLLPRGISIDGHDRLWVAEYDFSPRRISAWDTGSGDLLIERVGRGRYGGMGYYVLPDDPRQGVLLNNLVELDWDNARWRISGTLWRGIRGNEVLGFDPYTRLARVIHHDGRRLLVHTSLRPHRGPVIISELTKSGQAKPLAAIGPVSSALPHVAKRWQGGFEPAPIFAQHLWTLAGLNAAARKALPWFFDGPLAGDPRLLSRETVAIRDQATADGIRVPGGRLAPNANFVWSDLDADGGVDPGEIRYFATPGLDGPLPAEWQPEAWSGGVVGDDLAIYLTAIQKNQAFHYRLPVSRWTADGIPVYEPTGASLIAASPHMGQAAWLSAEGNLLTLANIPGKGRPDRQRDPLVMFRPDGSIAWTYPSPWTGVHGSHTAPKERRGQLVGPLGVLGSARIAGLGELFAFHTNVGTAELFTVDGLYLGRIFRDTRSVGEPWPQRPYRGQSLNNMSNSGEWFGGQFFQRPDGRTFIVASRHAGVIAEVTGLETTRRLDTQAVEITPALHPRAEGRPGTTPSDTRPDQAIRIARMSGAGGEPPPLTAFRWDPEHAARWRYDETRSARATWGWDETHLYVAFQIEDDTPMINEGDDVRQLFKSGDAAILELRTDPSQHDAQPSEGDIRLLFSIHRHKPVVVLYDYRDPSAEDPSDFSAATTTRIDRLTLLDEAQFDIERINSGYTLRAAVSLEDLGNWKPAPGETYPGDFGVVYSDKTGTTNVLRMNWTNQETGIISDLSLEADIHPTQWGRFQIGP